MNLPTNKDIQKIGRDLEDRFSFHHHNHGLSVSSLLIGAAVGSAIALLLAPKKGQELQADLSDGWNKVVGKAENWSQEAGAQAKNAMQTAEEKLKQTASQATRKAEHWGDKARDGAERAAEDLKNSMGDTEPFKKN